MLRICLSKEVEASNLDVATYVVDSDWHFWCPAFIPATKAHFYKLTSNNVEQEFKRFNNLEIRSKTPLAMCSRICALVQTCHQNFLQTCRRQVDLGRLLTPFATTIHDSEKKEAIQYKVVGLNANNPAQLCNVFLRNQEEYLRVAAHTSYEQCTCDFHLAMMIPCKHMEAWREKASKVGFFPASLPSLVPSPENAYKDWVKAKIMRSFQVDHIIEKVDHVTVLLPSGPMQPDAKLTLPAIHRRNQPRTHKDDRRMKARNEVGYQPRKRTRDLTPHEIAVDSTVRNATRGMYMMVKYKGLLHLCLHLEKVTTCVTAACCHGRSTQFQVFFPRWNTSDCRAFSSSRSDKRC